MEERRRPLEGLAQPSGHSARVLYIRTPTLVDLPGMCFDRNLFGQTHDGLWGEIGRHRYVANALQFHIFTKRVALRMRRHLDVTFDVA